MHPPPAFGDDAIFIANAMDELGLNGLSRSEITAMGHGPSDLEGLIRTVECETRGEPDGEFEFTLSKVWIENNTGKLHPPPRYALWLETDEYRRTCEIAVPHAAMLVLFMLNARDFLTLEYIDRDGRFNHFQSSEVQPLNRKGPDASCEWIETHFVPRLTLRGHYLYYEGISHLMYYNTILADIDPVFDVWTKLERLVKGATE